MCVRAAAGEERGSEAAVFALQTYVVILSSYLIGITPFLILDDALEHKTSFWNSILPKFVTQYAASCRAQPGVFTKPHLRTRAWHMVATNFSLMFVLVMAASPFLYALFDSDVKPVGSDHNMLVKEDSWYQILAKLALFFIMDSKHIRPFS